MTSVTGLENYFFDQKVALRILKEEGVIANRPKDHDPGGLTKYGITQGALDRFVSKQKLLGNRAAHQFPENVQNITVDHALAIYREDFWNDPGFENLPRWAGVLVFDSGVMSGPREAVRTLQKALGKIQVDGICGPQTQNRAWKHPDPDLVIDDFLKLRLRFLRSLRHSKHNPGWFPRTHRIARWAHQLAS